MTSIKNQWLSVAIFLFLLGLTLVVYWPGLKGPLVLDDISNLSRLQNIGPIDNLSDFYRFIFSSSSSYPLRPISFASFLINDNDWPLYLPLHKYTNILIHLINGSLVYWLSLLLCQATNSVSNRAQYIALSAAALWLLAPIQVSTVLYLIQRMTSLSALFTLCGLITYCYGRRNLNNAPGLAFFAMTSGIVGFGVLGFLSKQNALLLTLYVLTAELAILRYAIPLENERTRKWFELWKWVVLVAPVILVFTILIARGAFSAYQYYSYTAFERIISQPRVLLDYLQSILFPVRHGMGVVHDDFILSTGLLSPSTTILAIVVLAGLITISAWRARQHLTLAGFAILWFISGHLLESSFLALEPYFEHRNYLPTFGPFFAISYFVWTIKLHTARFIRAGFLIYILFFVAITKQNIDIWSNQALMSEVWAYDHPNSVRAQQIRADFWSRVGDIDKAFEIIDGIAETRRSSITAQVQLLLTACRAKPDRIDEYFNQAIDRIKESRYDHGMMPSLVSLKDTYSARCPKLSTDDMFFLIDTILRKESIEIRSKAVSDLLYLRATILAREAYSQDTVAHLYAAFHQHPNYDLGLVAVEYLYNIGSYQEAKKALRDVRNIDLKPWHPDNFRSKELDDWEMKIKEKLNGVDP